MKRISKILAVAFVSLTVCTINTNAQGCELPIAVYIGEQPEDVPDAALAVLENSLTRIATESGMNADFSFSDFILTAKVDVLGKDILPGPPIQISRSVGITLYIGDISTQTKFASAYMEFAGVGKNNTKCLIDAFRRLNVNNANIKSMLSSGKQKMMDYYDNSYKNILEKAKRKAALQQYEEAIALAVSIPVCSNGGDEATSTGLRIYGQYRDKINMSLLNKAYAVWSVGQNKQSAAEAGRLLAQIDPDASCYTEAISLASEIKKQVRSDIDFEMREKYKDQVKLEASKIDAMRAVGVAYGKGQKPKTTNITWLR